MAPKYLLKVQAILSYFMDYPKLITRGENAMESGHVVKLTYNDVNKIIIGDVHASMKDKCYKVEIYLDNDMSINLTTCTCPRGQTVCHHVAALALFAHHNISVTDGACSWSAPKKTKTVENVKTIDELFPTSKNYRATTRPLTANEIEEHENNLSSFAGAVGFNWLLSPEIQEEDTLLVPSVAEIIFGQQFRNASNKKQYLDDVLKITEDTSRKITECTIGQSENPKWLMYKKFRITASNFGVVLAAVKRNKYPPSLFKRLTGSYTLDGVKSIQWGRDHEKDAIEAFSNTTGLSVIKTGLHLDCCGYLGATPDGLVGSEYIIEVKCPFKYRNVDIIKSLAADKTYVCHYNSTLKQFTFNRDHEIYQQIQGQLHITKKKACYLIIWTVKTVVILNIKKELQWAYNMNLLRSFFHNHYVPYLLK